MSEWFGERPDGSMWIDAGLAYFLGCYNIVVVDPLTFEEGEG